MMNEMSTHSWCVRSWDDQLRWHLMPSPCCSWSTVWVEIVMVREPKSSSVNIDTAKYAHIMVLICLCLNRQCHDLVSCDVVVESK